jgi:hypothetical protein
MLCARACGLRILPRLFVFTIVITSTIVITIGSVGCGQPPDKEMQQAQGAIDAARAAGADKYAVEEFTAAQDALKRANDAVAQRDYRLALSSALDSRERAQNAAKMAADGAAAARVQADRAVSAATEALTAARASLKSGEAARAGATALNAARRSVADAERRLQEARAAFDRGDYGDAVNIAQAITKALTDATRNLDAQSAAAARRRR